MTTISTNKAFGIIAVVLFATYAYFLGREFGCMNRRQTSRRLPTPVTAASVPAAATPSSQPDVSMPRVEPKVRVAQINAWMTGDDSGHHLATAREWARYFTVEEACKTDVKKALALIERRQKDQDKIDATATKLAGHMVRKTFADNLERQMLRAGLESTVTMRGADKDTLHIESFLCGKVFIQKTFIDNEETLRGLEGGGFNRIECESSASTTTLPLTPKLRARPAPLPLPRCGTGRR